MSEFEVCPNCGSTIPAGSPEQMCPKCILQAGLASRSEWPPADPALRATVKSPGAAGGFVPPSPEELAPKFPQLEILELLGRGGMGAVYKARQPGLDRLVAVKILPPEISHDAAFAERFTREARALARLSHPHIVAVYDFGRTADNLFYFVMEFVDGVNLRQAIHAGGMTPGEAMAIVPQICEALQFAHDEGFVHRDIKPENILLEKKGRVKIADFGLAKLIGTEAIDQSLTGTQQVMGTLKYMAPEQMEGAKAVDHRADIYSLGVVFYELLTGELPIGRFAPPSKRVQIDVRLDEIVLRALEPEPELRWQHASDVKSELDGIRGNVGFTAASSHLPSNVKPATAPDAVLSTTHVSSTERSISAAANWLMLAGILIVGSPFVSFGLIAWMNVTTPASPFPGMTLQNVLEIAVALAVWSGIYAIVASILVIRGANSLTTKVATGDSMRACILAMLPLTPVVVFTLPIGLLVWKTLSRPDVRAELLATPPATPAIVPRVPLQDRPFYIAGRLTGMLLRQKWFLIGFQIVGSILYAICLFAVFSIEISTTPESHRFALGAPSPWLIDEVTPTRSRVTFQFLTWAYVPAAIGLAILAATRRLEFRERGRVHSIWWHYATWLLFLAFALGLLVLGRVNQATMKTQQYPAQAKTQSAAPETSTLFATIDLCYS